MASRSPTAGAAATKNRIAYQIGIAAAAMLLAVAGGYYMGSSPSLTGAQLTALTPLKLIAVGTGLGCLVLAVTCPEAGVLMLAALITTNASEVAVRYYAFASPLQWLALATAAGAAFRLVPREAKEPSALILDPLLLPLAFFGTAILASSIGAHDLALADDRLSDFFKATVVFLVITNVVASHQMLERLVWAVVLSGAALATVTAFQFITGSYGEEFGGFGRVKVAQIVGSTREPRAAASLSDPNFYAQLLVLLVPLALYRVWDDPSPRNKIVAGYGLATTLVALVFTYSRGGAVALGVIVILTALHRRVRPKHLLLGLLALAPLTFVLPQSFTGRLITLKELAPAMDGVTRSGEDTSFRQRQEMMTSALEMFSDYPLLGVGAGNYAARFDEYAGRVGTTLRSYDNFGQARYPHNLYLEILAEMGLAGLVAFIAVMAATIASLWKAYRSFAAAGAMHSANLTASLAIALGAYVVTSLFLHGTYIRYLWLLVAMAAAARQVAQRSAPEQTDV